MLSHYGCLALCDPHGLDLPVSSVYGIFQARILEWVDISSTTVSNWTHISCISYITGRFFTSEPPGNPIYIYVCVYMCTYISCKVIESSTAIFGERERDFLSFRGWDSYFILEGMESFYINFLFLPVSTELEVKDLFIFNCCDSEDKE